ncbi:hypothetical protein Bca101_048931 [Brassica carinata]
MNKHSSSDKKVHTDKASLLAEVIQHVKELKRETSVVSETNLVPTESNELTVAFTEMADS